MIKKNFSYICFRVIRFLVKVFYPKISLVGVENIPNEPCILVGNHSQMHGPIACELYLDENYYTWCAGQMMHLKDVPAYAYQDFWSGKPKYIRWFYKGLSYVIAPLAVCIFNNARTIGVYHDTRIIGTFKDTLIKLTEGKSIVIFPECYEEHNNIVNNFQNRYIDIALQYNKRTEKALPFVPMYIAPNLKKIYFGKPVYFSKDLPIKEERIRISEYLMNEITEIAIDLPVHTVVPYANISKKNYPKNRED